MYSGTSCKLLNRFVSFFQKLERWLFVTAVIFQGRSVKLGSFFAQIFVEFEGGDNSFVTLNRNYKNFIKNFRANFDLGIWFKSIAHGRQSDFEKIGYQAGSCPVAEKTAKHIVNFPTHEGINIDFLLEKIDKSLSMADFTGW